MPTHAEARAFGRPGSVRELETAMPTETTNETTNRLPSRILVLTAAAEVAPELLDAMAERAADGEVRFRLVVLNPARAEVHLLHPERHDKADEAERALRRTLPRVEAALGGGRVIGSVSVRHDPMDAVEETLDAEPIEEIWLHVQEHALTRRVHQDLAHRLSVHHLPVRVVEHPASSAVHHS